MPASTPSKVLRAAAELIETKGWTEPRPGRRCRCSLCALDRVVERAGPASNREYRSAARALLDHLGVDEVSVWEKAPGRTAAEVIAALRSAGDEAEKENTHAEP